jgi:hypothetical protein
MRTTTQSDDQHRPKPEARYGYYRRCQVFRRNGEQCKAPAENGALICYAHANQLATAVRRERERRAVLVEAVAEMRRGGRPECEMADLFMDFKGINVTLAVMAQALIDGRIDCKTAGQMVVHLQTCSKLLWQIHRKGRKERKALPLINTDDTDQKKLPKAPEVQKSLPRINADDADQKKLPKAPEVRKIAESENPKPLTAATPRNVEEDKKPLPLIISDDADWKNASVERNLAGTCSAGRKPEHAPTYAKILQFKEAAFEDRCRGHGPPKAKAA